MSGMMFNKYRVIKYTDGYYVAERRVWLFFWTNRFPKEGGGKRGGKSKTLAVTLNWMAENNFIG